MDQKYIYECNGQKQYDYCNSCERPVIQIDLGGGVMGCEYCKSANHIEVIDIKEPMTIDRQTVGFVEVTALVPQTWVCWFYQLISDSAPFSWGDNNRTLVTASRFHEHCVNRLDDVVEDPPIDSDEAPTQEEVDTFLETVKGLGETYIDLEN